MANLVYESGSRYSTARACDEGSIRLSGQPCGDRARDVAGRAPPRTRNARGGRQRESERRRIDGVPFPRCISQAVRSVDQHHLALRVIVAREEAIEVHAARHPAAALAGAIPLERVRARGHAPLSEDLDRAAGDVEDPQLDIAKG